MGGCLSRPKATPVGPPHPPAVKKTRKQKKNATVAFQLQNGVSLPGVSSDNDIRARSALPEVTASQVTPEVEDLDNPSILDGGSSYATPSGTPRGRIARLTSANDVFHDADAAFVDSDEEYEAANSDTLPNPYVAHGLDQRRSPSSHFKGQYLSRLPTIPSNSGPDQLSSSRGGAADEETLHRNTGAGFPGNHGGGLDDDEGRFMRRRMSDPGVKRSSSLNESRPPHLQVGDDLRTPGGSTPDDSNPHSHLHLPKAPWKSSTGAARKHTPERSHSRGRRWSEPEPPEDEPTTSGGIVCLPKIRIGLDRPDSRGGSFRKEKKFFMFGRRSSAGGGGETPDGRRRIVRMPHWGESVNECSAGGGEEGCWSKVDAASFVLRGKTYMKDKKKIMAPMQPIYDLLAVDVYHSVKKLMHVAQLMDFPCRGEPLGRDGLPRLLVVNLQFPLYTPSIFGGAENQDGEGFNVIMCFRLNEEFEKNPPPAAFALLKRFLTDEQEKVGLMGSQVSLRDRLKLIAAMRNLEEVDMSLAERKLASTYNGKPVLSRPQHVFFQEDNYLEVDIDVHRFSFLARKGLEAFRQRLKQMVIDFALIIQGNRPEELPEHVLCCACVNKFDFVHPALAILDEDHREPRTPQSLDMPSVKA